MRRGALVLVAVIAFVAALGGVAAGRWLVPMSSGSMPDLHRIVATDPSLDADQRRRIAALEAEFRTSHQAAMQAMHDSNAALADAIDREHAIGPQVDSAILASHATMGAMQREVIVHLFKVRKVLRPDQAARFDGLVRRTLTQSAK